MKARVTPALDVERRDDPASRPLLFIGVVEIVYAGRNGESGERGGGRGSQRAGLRGEETKKRERGRGSKGRKRRERNSPPAKKSQFFRCVEKGGNHAEFT